MQLPSPFFFWLTVVTVFIMGPLFLFNPFMCDADIKEFATAAFAEEARNSKLLFASDIAILIASLAPLLDAVFDLRRYVRGFLDEMNPYTLNRDRNANAVYLAERLFVILVYDLMAILELVVTTPGSNYDPGRFLYRIAVVC
jgi:hypothetical protein